MLSNPFPKAPNPGNPKVRVRRLLFPYDKEETFADMSSKTQINMIKQLISLCNPGLFARVGLASYGASNNKRDRDDLWKLYSNPFWEVPDQNQNTIKAVRCHSCGTIIPHIQFMIADHQPPNNVVKRGLTDILFEDLYILKQNNVPFEIANNCLPLNLLFKKESDRLTQFLYPHCNKCSEKQGYLLSQNLLDHVNYNLIAEVRNDKRNFCVPVYW